MHTRFSFQLSAYNSNAARKSFQLTANVTSQYWQLARNSFLKYSSSLGQTNQNFYSARKTRQHDVDKFMKFNSAKKTRQDDVDKFLKIDKMNEFAILVGIFTVFRPLFKRER